MSDLLPPWKYENPLCAEIGTELFYIEDKDINSGRAKLSAYDEAKKICSLCTHIKDCFKWAIENEKHGFWGGYSPAERREMRKNLNIILKEDLSSAS